MTNVQKLHVAFDQLFCFGNNVEAEDSCGRQLETLGQLIANMKSPTASAGCT